MRRGRDGGRRVADRLLEAGGEVAGHVVVHQVLGRAGRGEADDRLQELVVDPDPGDRVLGEVAVVGHHEGDRLADVVDAVLGQGVLRATVGERLVRDQQRQRVRHRAGQVVVGVDGVHALDVEDAVDVDVEDPRVGVGAAQHGDLQGAAHQVVGVLPVAAQQTVVLDALDLLADQLGGHEASSPAGVVVRAISAARHTDATMFW